MPHKTPLGELVYTWLGRRDMTLKQLADAARRPDMTDSYPNLCHALYGRRPLPGYYCKAFVEILLNDRKNYPAVIYRHEFQRYLTLIPTDVYRKEEAQEILESLPVKPVKHSESVSSEVEEKWKAYIADTDPATLGFLLTILLQRVISGYERSLPKELRLEVEGEWKHLKGYERGIKIALVKLLIDDLKKH